MKSERSAAFLLLGAAMLGLIVANSPFGPAFLDFKFTYCRFRGHRPEPDCELLG